MSSNDLIDFMKQATQEIDDEYNRIQKRALEDPGTAGDQGEENWASLMRKWLPPTFHIVTKGRILSEAGTASPQVDIIVLQPEYPEFLLDKKLYLAGGVLAAFECKMSIKSKHIEEFIENSIAISDNMQHRTGSPYKELNSTILFGLLAHSHSWKKPKSKPIINIEKKLYKEFFGKVTHPVQMPDIICVADLATWASIKIPFIKLDLDSIARTGYVRHSEVGDQDTNSTPMGSMITVLLQRLAWEYPGLRSLAKYFKTSGVHGGDGRGKTRNWNSNIYSEELMEKVKKGYPSSREPWNEWSSTFL